jgi:hypothetical protein
MVEDSLGGNQSQERVPSRRDTPRYTSQVRMWGVWMMIICDPEDRQTRIVVFNEWEWDHPKVVRPLEGLATQLKFLAMEEGLELQENIRKERETPFWPYPFSSNENDKSRFGFVKRTVAKFFKVTQNLQEVRPSDRLIAFWSVILDSTRKAMPTFGSFKKRHRKDIELMERLWLIQALFTTSQMRRPYIATGHEVVSRDR